MRIAIISDIHANHEALKAVLKEIESSEIDQIVCLGDVIGYGPDPMECIDSVQEHCSVCLLGNHDFACRTEPRNFNQLARDAALWTAKKLTTPWPDEAAVNRRLEYLDSLPVRHYLEADKRVLCVHGSTRCPTNEYVFPDDSGIMDHMEALFRGFESICFQGHTHWPGVFVRETFNDPEGNQIIRHDFHPGYREERRSEGPDGIGIANMGVAQMPLLLSEGNKYMINPGSVGQPRDGDRWACWAILELDDDPDADPVLHFRRTYYDWMLVRDRIRRTQDAEDPVEPVLGEFLGTRLGMGT